CTPAGENDIVLLVRSVDPANTATWNRFVVWNGTQQFTRPIVLLNLQASTPVVRIFASKLGNTIVVPDDGTGEVFEKSSPLSSISFIATDLGTLRLKDDGNRIRINDVTSTKQNFTDAWGLVILADHEDSGFYWHNDL